MAHRWIKYKVLCVFLSNDFFLWLKTFIIVFFIFVNNFVLFYSLYSILFHIGLRCTAQLANHILYKVFPQYFCYPPGTKQLLQYYWLYSLCWTLYPHDYVVSTNFYLLFLSCFSPSSPGSAPRQPLVHALYLWVCFNVVYFAF